MFCSFLTRTAGESLSQMKQKRAARKASSIGIQASRSDLWFSGAALCGLQPWRGAPAAGWACGCRRWSSGGRRRDGGLRASHWSLTVFWLCIFLGTRNNAMLSWKWFGRKKCLHVKERRRKNNVKWGEGRSACCLICSYNYIWAQNRKQQQTM